MSDFDALEEIKVGDLTVKIINDDEPSDPREGSDQLGVMACFHPEYTIGDKHRIDPHEFAGWDELERHLIRVEGALCVAPLYLYDHSGLQMKIGSFAGLLPQGHAEFDTMQVGFIYTTRQRMKEMCGWTRLTEKVQGQVDKQLEAEVETYNQYLRGDVYGYIIEDEVGLLRLRLLQAEGDVDGAVSRRQSSQWCSNRPVEVCALMEVYYD